MFGRHKQNNNIVWIFVAGILLIIIGFALFLIGPFSHVADRLFFIQGKDADSLLEKTPEQLKKEYASSLEDIASLIQGATDPSTRTELEQDLLIMRVPQESLNSHFALFLALRKYDDEQTQETYADLVNAYQNAKDTAAQ